MIPKTYKLYSNGAWIRSESGNVTAQTTAQGATVTYSTASRKDWREAQQAARAAHPGWAILPAFQRGLILYRMAEILTSRAESLIESLQTGLGSTREMAEREVRAGIDLLFSYAGWADKYQSVYSSVNSVSAPFFNATVLEPLGVVAVFCSQQSPLVGLIEGLLPVILSGNTAILFVKAPLPTLAIDFSEVIAVSDVPKGVVNILTGPFAPLLESVVSHYDLDAVSYFGNDESILRKLQTVGCNHLLHVRVSPDPVESVWQQSTSQSASILSFVHYKTIWQPVGD